MYLLEKFIIAMMAYPVILDIFNIVFGISVCYGALKWRKGLLSTVALYWGFVIGILVIGILLFFTNANINPNVAAALLVICTIGFCILTYTVASVNRFVLGFIVTAKIALMFTTVMIKNGSMELLNGLLLPLWTGVSVGLILAAWQQFSVSAFVYGSAFLGASQAAPVIAKYINQLLFGITGNPTYVLDPIDFGFSLLHIELTDTPTLISLLLLMAVGIVRQIYLLKSAGFPLDTPIIAYEIDINQEPKRN